MFSIFTHVISRGTHSELGLPVIWHLHFPPKSTELTVAEKGIFLSISGKNRDSSRSSSDTKNSDNVWVLNAYNLDHC